MRWFTGRIMAGGARLILEHNGRKIPARGFLQPIRGRGKQDAETEAGPLGRYSQSRFLLFTPAGVPAAAGDRVSRGDRRFRIRQTELVYAGNDPVYRRSLCVEEGDSPWTM